MHSPTQPQDDSTRRDEEATSDFWTITREFIYRHQFVPRVKLYVPREESFPTPMKYIDVTRTRYTSLGVLLEKILKIGGTWMEKENCQIHGQASHGPGKDSRGNKQPLVQMIYGQMCGSKCLMQQKRKQNKDGLSRNQSSKMLNN